MRPLINPEDEAGRYAADLESALLARALAETGSLTGERTKALLRQWLHGTFNASAHAIETGCGLKGDLAWEPDGEGFRLVWYAPSGLACPLARLYRQADDSWAALIVAGVRDDLLEAIAAAEWGIARLAA